MRWLSGCAWDGVEVPVSSPQATEQRWEQLWLPLWPLASDDLRFGIFREARETALNRRYIETNPKVYSNLLVVDIDHRDARLRALWDRRKWLPNALTINPDNGHAHAVWALQEPITRTEYAHRKPIAYAAAITEGLRRSVDGDAGYSGLMTKNPNHQAWEAEWWSEDLYSLPQLEAHLAEAGFMPAKGWERTRRKNPIGLGRNCSLFETARHWAYREVRNHFGNAPALRSAIHGEVNQRNADFSEALPNIEAHHLAESIWRWITTKSRMWNDGATTYEATFITIQSARSRKAAEKRNEQALTSWQAEALEMMK